MKRDPIDGVFKLALVGAYAIAFGSAVFVLAVLSAVVYTVWRLTCG